MSIEDFNGSEFGPPSAPGVYMVCLKVFKPKGEPAGPTHVVYVGSSGNIHKRVTRNDHPYMRLFSDAEWPLMVITKWMITDDYKAVEKMAIAAFKPPMNIQYNG